MIKTILNRPLTSYTKVQLVISSVIRGKRFQLKKYFDKKKYLDVGCGPNTNESFINLDYTWSPNVDICWDITKKEYPFVDNRFEGIYTEHCLEHIPFYSFKDNIKEFYRILKPNGVLRIILPDGELYLDIYQKRKEGINIQMPYEEGYISPMARINGIFRNHGHLFIYDFETVKLILEDNGFKNIRKMIFKEGINPDLLNDTEHRKIESLYIECQK